ncbi:ribosomal protein L13e-domain-containing protein [Mycena leptocephala]|nr:ribosomal protein L13e-domain-containing protein [Mycena leptocephala]
MNAYNVEKRAPIDIAMWSLTRKSKCRGGNAYRQVTCRPDIAGCIVGWDIGIGKPKKRVRPTLPLTLDERCRVREMNQAEEEEDESSFPHSHTLLHHLKHPQDLAMGFAHNNVLHANHFRKDWQRRVRTWFDQPGRKLRRRTARKTKATTLGVRPIEPLRPAVRAQTVRYNRKSTAESERGGQKINVERLLAYKSKLIVFPRKAGKPKKGDSTGDDLTASTTRASFPLPEAYPAEAPRKITAEEREFKAYRALRDARATRDTRVPAKRARPRSVFCRR